MARTLRERFGVGLSDLGGAVSWGEALTLIESAAGDASTALGAELASWAYPATIPELISLVAQIGDQKASKKLMPWSNEMKPQRREIATETEVLEASEILEGNISFASE